MEVIVDESENINNDFTVKMENALEKLYLEGKQISNTRQIPPSGESLVEEGMQLGHADYIYSGRIRRAVDPDPSVDVEVSIYKDLG